MVTQNATMSKQPVAADEQKDVKLRYLYPLTEFGGGIWKSYFSSFISMLYTDVYLIPVALSGILEMVNQFAAWFAGPIFGTILDKFSFKRGKFWPWVLIGSVCVAAIEIIIFSIPSLSANPAKIVFFVFLLAVGLAFAQQVTDVSMISVYPRLASTPDLRTFLSSGRQIGKNLGQSVFGYLVPIMLGWFAAVGGSEASGWALTAVVISIAGLLFYVAFGLTLKNSELEKNILREKAGAKRKVTLLVMLRSLATNGPLLVIFCFFAIYQIFMFMQLQSAPYFFKYFYKDFSVMSLFSSGRTLATAIGTFTGIFWVKLLRDSKRAFIAAGMCVIVTILAMSLVVSTVSPKVFVILVIIQNFFCGVVGAILLPLFAAASDYGTLKSGVRTDGLNMSTYNLAIKVGITLSTTVRTAILASVGYNAKLYAAGTLPTAEVLNQLKNLQTLYPLILSVLCFALVFFFYPITDARLREIRAELKARETATAQAS